MRERERERERGVRKLCVHVCKKREAQRGRHMREKENDRERK